MSGFLHSGGLMIRAAILLLLLQGCGDAGNRLALFFEEGKIRDAARRYLDAEVKRDLKAVYACLAPSSHYMAANPSYAKYREEADRSPVRIVDYQILSISQLRDNHDPAKYPRIEKFVQVEVDVNLAKEENKERIAVNYSFTFIKEGGKWYKG
ncbi:MAG: hypothetical protein JW943_03600 [Deltaproteobacteria bacterium]|nr:hypothetical protein [Deltaproteobacteria bacterium]